MSFRHRPYPHELAASTPRHSRLFRSYEAVYDLNDFLAGVVFVVGSILFFWTSTEDAATWFFLIGSVQFTVRPAIHLARDIHLSRLPRPDSPRTHD